MKKGGKERLKREEKERERDHEVLEGGEETMFEVNS